MLLCNLDIFNLNEGTNRQKRELFVVAVRSASGDTLPVNLTIIPSAQKWVSAPLRVRAPVIMLLRLTSPLASLPLTASSVVLALGGDFFFWRFGGMVDLAGDGRAERELELDMFSSKWSRLNLLEAGEEGAVVQFRRTSKKRQ